MEKYKESLDRLSHNAYQSVDNEFRYGCGSIDKNEIKQHHEDVSRIKELVDKATPMKPMNVWDNLGMTNYTCPNCTLGLTSVNKHEAYCYKCGQALDWSEDE